MVSHALIRFRKDGQKKETENVEENIDKGRRKKQKEEDPPIKKEKTKDKKENHKNKH